MLQFVRRSSFVLMLVSRGSLQLPLRFWKLLFNQVCNINLTEPDLPSWRSSDQRIVIEDDSPHTISKIQMLHFLE